ncbi:MAG: type II secretion system protein [Microgenomates group bacterium]
MKKFLISNILPISNIKYQISNAFTLLEMLVVIGIIAVLIGMGAVSYSTAQRKARDAKRKSDLKAIQNALEQYYSICNYQYPSSYGFLGSGSLTCDTQTVISTAPKDPLGQNYQCVGTCNASQYTICSPNVNGTSRLESANCTSGSECCVSNQQ